MAVSFAVPAVTAALDGLSVFPVSYHTPDYQSRYSEHNYANYQCSHPDLLTDMSQTLFCCRHLFHISHIYL